MYRIFLLVLLFPFLAIAQVVKDNSAGIDPDKMKIDKNIFRVLLSLSTDTKFSITGSYEREIKRPLTVFFKAGPAIDRASQGTDVNGTEQYRYIFNAIASGELRYYYNLNRRARLEKTIRNFSAFYLSIEEQLVSKPVFIMNKTGTEVLKGRTSAFVNIGYQYQKNTTFYNIYFGTRFPGQIYSNIPVGIELLHGGITVGRAF